MEEYGAEKTDVKLKAFYEALISRSDVHDDRKVPAKNDVKYMMT